MSDPDSLLAAALRPARWARIQAVLDRRLGAVRVVLENLHHPHNTSAVLRTCEALGVQHVHLVESVEECRPSRRVSRGAHKWLTVTQHDGFPECADLLRERGFRLFAAMLDPAARPLEQIPVAEPVALVFGNEKDGIAPATRERCDGSFRIPMAGFVQSFNISVAAAISLYSLTGRVRRERPDQGLLSAAERARVLADWLPRSVRCGTRLVRAVRGA